MVEVAGTLGRGYKTTMERGAGVPSPGSTSRCANTAILCSLVLHDLRDLTQFAFYFCLRSRPIYLNVVSELVS